MNSEGDVRGGKADRKEPVPTLYGNAKRGSKKNKKAQYFAERTPMQKPTAHVSCRGDYFEELFPPFPFPPLASPFFFTSLTICLWLKLQGINVNSPIVNRVRMELPGVGSSSEEVVGVPAHLLSRLLYTNPVCLLSSFDQETRASNVCMQLSCEISE